MSDQVFWFATRGAGIMAWFAASLSIIVGLLLSSRALGRRPTIPWLLDVHRFCGASSVVFLALHLVTLWADSFVELSVADLVIPGRAVVPGLTRASMAWGVIAAWMLIVVEGTSLIKNRLPEPMWHTLHLGSYGVVASGAVHAIQTGSDADNRVLISAAVSVLTAIGLLTLTRISRLLGHRKLRYDVALADLDRPAVSLLAVGDASRTVDADDGSSSDRAFEEGWDDAAWDDRWYGDDRLDGWDDVRAAEEPWDPGWDDVRAAEEPWDPGWTGRGSDR